MVILQRICIITNNKQYEIQKLNFPISSNYKTQILWNLVFALFKAVNQRQLMGMAAHRYGQEKEKSVEGSSILSI